MKAIVALGIAASLLFACNSRTPNEQIASEEKIAPREATDPVPEPPTLPDTGNTSPKATQSTRTEPAEKLYRITGTEPFWSLSLAQPYSTFRSMEGDSLSFPYQPPTAAAGRPDDWAQLYLLGKGNWVLLRKGGSPCSDGMSDREWAYTATLWLNGRLFDGCGEQLTAAETL